MQRVVSGTRDPSDESGAAWAHVVGPGEILDKDV
jgi:hypothetical protein